MIKEHKANNYKIKNQKGYPSKTLEDYSTIFHLQTSNIYQLPKPEFQEKLQNSIDPLLQFATNLGFQKWNINPKS